MKTKERILNSALSLFSRNGYDGTSMEQIADLVGIKAPSLYKHFKGKEDILNELISIAESRYEEFFGSDSNIGKIPENHEEMIEAQMKRIRFTMSDPMIRMTRIFLVKEQFRNKKLAEITSKHQIDGLQKMYTRIIEGMMEKGLFRKDDPQFLALELISPVSLLISKADREIEFEKEALELIEKHIRHFCDVYK